MPPNSVAAPATLTAGEIEKRLHRLLPRVEKPGRYTGGELNQVVKDWDATALHTALVFPDVYDLGMSNLGVAILYDILNRQPDMLAERVYAPWPDMEAALRQAGLPLYGLETKHPLRAFDLIGVSLPYETLYTNVLTILELGGVPVRASSATRPIPLVIAGGHATYNPEPMAEFIDAFAIGEGEEVVLEIARTVLEWKRSGQPRLDLLPRPGRAARRVRPRRSMRWPTRRTARLTTSSRPPARRASRCSSASSRACPHRSHASWCRTSTSPTIVSRSRSSAAARAAAASARPA